MVCGCFPAAGNSATRRTRSGFTLYDRSEETWTHTPHPEGPLDPDDDRLAVRSHLRRQMQATIDLGAASQAWVATQPTITAVTTALDTVDADVVVVAEDLLPRLLERTLDGDPVAEKLRHQIRNQSHLDATVIEVGNDGIVKQPDG